MTGDPRLGDLSTLILRIAGGDYAARGEPSDERDEIDALTVGLSLLAETLQLERGARDQAESLLRDELHAYEHAPGMFCSVEAAAFRIVKCNDTFAAAVALDKDQVLGRSLPDFVVSEERAALADSLRRTLGGKEASRSEFVIVTADGRQFPALMSATAADDELSRLRLIFRDVSAERSLEAQLRHAQKMEAVGRLASGVAHDFNNILTVILASAERLRMRGEAESETAMIIEAGERAAELTRQLLAFGRTDLARPEVHDLNGLVHGARRLLERTLDEQAQLVLALRDEALPILVDETQLTQVLLNLTINARDAMADGGVLTISSELEDGDPPLAVLTVADTGTGMEAEVLERAFEPFFTTKEAARGSGLGLSVCYGIVRGANGSLKLSSRRGVGTTARIAFPLTKPLQAPRSPSRVRAVTEGKGESVLVVDDSPSVRKLIARVLAESGYEVASVADAEEALRVAEGGDFEILVTDVVMPGMSGVELARRLRDRRPSLPVLLVSGYAGDHVDVDVLRSPGTGFLQKPFTAVELTEHVGRLLAAANDEQR